MVYDIPPFDLWHSPMLTRVPGVRHAFTTRVGGFSWPRSDTDVAAGEAVTRAPVREEHRQVLAAMGLADGHLVRAAQVHGTRVVVVDDSWGALPADCTSVVAGADALLTRRQDVCLSLCFADCVPVYLTTSDGRFVGLAHAGWRGVAANMPGVVVAAAREAFGVRPEEILVALGPAIGACCYEVGEEVVAALALACPDRDRAWLVPRQPRPHVDLRAIARAQLLAAGVRAGGIQLAACCTACEAALMARGGDG